MMKNTMKKAVIAMMAALTVTGAVASTSTVFACDGNFPVGVTELQANVQVEKGELSMNELLMNELSMNELSTNELLTNELSTNELLTNKLSMNELSTNKLSTNELIAL